MQPLMSIELYSNAAKIEESIRGARRIKWTTINALKEAFSDKNIVTPVFPMWVVKYSLIGTRLELITCRNTGGMLKYNHVSNVECNLNLPYIYMKFTADELVGSYSMVHTNVYTSYYPPGEDTDIYVPVLANVNTDGYLCWGNAMQNIKKITKMEDFMQIENLFYIAPHNNDFNDIDKIMVNNNIKFEDKKTWAASNIVFRNTKKKLKEL